MSENSKIFGFGMSWYNEKQSFWKNLTMSNSAISPATPELITYNTSQPLKIQRGIFHFVSLWLVYMSLFDSPFFLLIAVPLAVQAAQNKEWKTYSANFLLAMLPPAPKTSYVFHSLILPENKAFWCEKWDSVPLKNQSTATTVRLLFF